MTESGLDDAGQSALRQPDSQKDAVVLVHGIWMHGLLMKYLAAMLTKHGFQTTTFSYRFLKRSPAENAQQLHKLIEQLPNQRVHLVGHSLGGIVVLHLFNQYKSLPEGRIVLLGSPVNGSVVAKRIASYRLLRGILGRSTEAGLLGGAPVYQDERELGIIRGTLKFGLVAMVQTLQERNDGVVAESETTIDKASDYTEVALSHTSMVFSRRTALLVAQFLKHGRFKP